MLAARRRMVCTQVALLLVMPLFAGCVAPPEPIPGPHSWPLPTPVDPVQQYADDRLGVMTLDEKLSSMLMAHLPGLAAATLADYAASQPTPRPSTSRESSSPMT